MNPEEINALALRAIGGLAIILTLIALVGWATGGDSSPVLVAGASLEASAQTVGTLGADGGTVPPTSVTATTPSNATTTAPAIEAGATTTGSTPPTTEADPDGAATTTTVERTTTTTPGPTTTTTLGPTTTTTVERTTTTTVGPTTTTLGPTTTTTVERTTTTTVRPTTTTTTTIPTTTTTTTTIPPTTTTTIPPTTTTTIPPTTTTTTTTIPPTTTTTTTIALPAIRVHKFEGHDHGDVGAWEAHIKVEIRTENGDKAPFATVEVAWGGTDPGSQTLASDKDGNIDTRLGLFADSSITLRITDVRLSGYAYRPSLNEVSATLLVAGPN